MTSHWVVLAALLTLASGQLFNNGFINPLFLSRAPQSRGGRLYDPWTTDLRDNGYYRSRGGVLRVDDVYRDRGLPYDSRFDERKYPSRYDDFRRYPNRYDDFQSYPSRYDDPRRYLNRFDDYRRLPVDSDRRYNEVYSQYPEDVRYLQSVRLATTVRPEDRVQFLDRGQGVERGQIVSTATPDLSVTVLPNGSS